MSPKSRFAIRFAPEVIAHLGLIEKKYHGLIQKTIDEQLSFEPETETRNRKFLEHTAPYGATWELRLGPNNRFRAFYEILPEELEVWILAIGVKDGNRLRIGREEFEL